MEKDFVFFLGGYDLEMVTIKNILEENKKKYFDKELSWGAKASEYKEELEKIPPNKIPVLLELDIDIELHSEYKLIDHHNERSGADKKTSIEQVAELLKIELTREQKLIAANDRAYIDGLLEMNATEEEINKITEEDAKAQGVTEEDKKYAKTSVDHFLTKLDEDTVLIQSLTDKTSAVTCLVYRYYRHIFIITPENKFIYSGSGKIIEKLKEKYSELKKDSPKINYWYGGNLPDKGYFGANEPLKKKEIEELCSIMPEKRIHSQHIFMFPFRIDAKEIETISSSTGKLEKIHERLENSSWEYKPFQMSLIPEEIKKKHEKRTTPYSADEIWAYNEYNYFYDCVRDTLFNTTLKKKLFDEKEKVPVSLYYEMGTKPNDEMFIYIKDRPEPYRLSINHLSLRIFETGIGILSITLYNYCYTEFQDVLCINDFGRRIYPQFLGEHEGEKEPVEKTKGSFLPDKILFAVNGKPNEEDFPTEKFMNTDNHFASYIEELLMPLHNSKNKLTDEEHYKEEWIVIPIIDDRMYTICWYENNKLLTELQAFDKEKMTFNYENNRDWYMYVYVDSKFAGVGNDKMRYKLINDTTYSRFIDDGSIIGISRYSFVCLCNVDYDKERDFGYKTLRNHMQKMYFQMCILLLAQRASIIKFNKELKNISEDADKYFRVTARNKKITAENNNFIERAERLNKDVILFRSRIWFDEVTPQEQGIELYDLSHKNMDTEKQLQSLGEKIRELHDFLSMKLENQKTTNIQGLTVVSIIFAVMVSILAFWAIDFSFLEYWKGFVSKYNTVAMLRSYGMFVSSGIGIIIVALLAFEKRAFITIKMRYKILLRLALFIFAVLFLSVLFM
jgi:hypothetical protein